MKNIFSTCIALAGVGFLLFAGYILVAMMGMGMAGRSSIYSDSSLRAVFLLAVFLMIVGAVVFYLPSRPSQFRVGPITAKLEQSQPGMPKSLHFSHAGTAPVEEFLVFMSGPPKLYQIAPKLTLNTEVGSDFHVLRISDIPAGQSFVLWAEEGSFTVQYLEQGRERVKLFL